MMSRTLDAAERGLPNSRYAVTVAHDDDVVGMGRVVGDGGTVFQLTAPASKAMYLRIE